MGLFGRKKKKNNIDAILGRVTEEILSKEDMRDEKTVRVYLLDHCRKMIETAKHLETEKAEYRELTSQIKDIQLIEELPKKEKAILRETATNIITLQKARDEQLHKKKKITDVQYAQMQQDEQAVMTAIRSLQSNEKYQSTVKRDMQYLESEKNEWIYYRQDLVSEQKFLRRLAYVLFGLLLMLMTIVLVLQMGFDIDARFIFMMLILAGGVGGAGIFIRMQNNTASMKKAEVNMNHAITLENKVKLKYVHSTNAVDYLCEKYHVKNSYELNYLWEQYLEAARDMEKFERNSEDLDYFSGKLLRNLHKFNVSDPKIWLDQTAAILNPKEMESRKQELLQRREALKSRITYNMDVVLEQKEEVQNLLDKSGHEIPEVREIITSVDKLCGA